MANFAATIANKGYYYFTPPPCQVYRYDRSNLCRSIWRNISLLIDSANFRIAADAMENVVNEGMINIVLH